MQHCRTLARKAPITCATLIGIVGPLLIAALLVLGWLAPAWWRRLRRREARTALLLGWVALVIVFFTLSPGKRGVYMLPAAPESRSPRSSAAPGS